MRSATYMGPIAELRGQKAHVWTELGTPGMLLAQFNDMWVHHPRHVETRADLKDTDHGKAMLGFGWHPFPVGHFQLEGGEARRAREQMSLALQAWRL